MSRSHISHISHNNVVPKIDSNQMNIVFKELVKSFKMVERITPLWICGRKTNFGFRPSLIPFLQDILKHWISQVEQGKVVVVPIIFYTCDSKDIEKVEKIEEDKTQENGINPDFFVYNHYNVLVSYMTSNGSINIERYEPSNSLYQGNLQENLVSLFMNFFKKHTSRKIIFKLVTPKGLQAIYKDRTLCGHHIVYWTIYRLKHGLKNSIEMLTDELTIPRFERFCRCIKSGGRCDV